MTEDKSELTADEIAAVEKIEETPEKEPEEAAGKSTKRLSSAEWAEITERWELGTIKLKQISEKYGISESAIYQYFKRHNIFYGSRKGEVSKTVETAVKTVVSNFESKRAARIEELKETIYGRAKAIGAVNIKRMVEAERPGGRSLAAAYDDLKALRLIEKINSETARCMIDILQANRHINEDDLPEIKIRDLSEKEIEILQEADESDDDGLEDLVDTEVEKEIEEDLVVEGE